METPELEKIIKKLESLDISRWKYTYEPSFSDSFLIVETNGLRFSIKKRGSTGCMENSLRYVVFIENAEDEITNNCCIEHIFDKKNKPQREMLKSFYNQTLTSLNKYKEKVIKEKLNDFVSE